MNKEMREKVKLWTSFYRENPHRFAEDYLGVNLRTFQKILVCLMFKYPFFTYLASRGLGKSFLIAVIAVIKCILYPGSIVVVASGTKGQAAKIINSKIKDDLALKYPNITREIKDIKQVEGSPVVLFNNGSKISCVTVSDSGRGDRANLIIVDEHALVKKNNYDKIIEPFATYIRQPGYLKYEEYEKVKDPPNQIIFMSSATYKSSWTFNDALDCINSMCSGKQTKFVTAIPYHLGVIENIITPDILLKAMDKSDFDPATFGMEYECKFFGEANGAFLKLIDFDKNRNLTIPYIPRKPTEIFEDIEKYGKPKPKHYPKQPGEIRIISVDISMIAGKKNDSTVNTFLRLLKAKSGNYYIKQVVNTIATEGKHSDVQAKLIKRNFYDFEADYLVMDVNGTGLGVYDSLAKVSFDDETGQEYPAFGAFNKDQYMDRVQEEDSNDVIFTINPGVELNHVAAMNVKSNLEKQRLQLLVDFNTIIGIKGNNGNLDIEQEADKLRPFVNTTMMINETISLEKNIVRERYIQLKEVGAARKDRYSSLSYGVYFANILEQELEEEDANYNVEVMCSMF